MESIASLLPLILIVAVFYLLLVRPARNRQRAVRDLQSRVGIGARVVTTAGLYGTVVDVDDDTIVLDTGVGAGPGSPLGASARSRWARGAVGRILEPAAASGSADGAGTASPTTPPVDLRKPVDPPDPDTDGGPPRA